MTSGQTKGSSDWDDQDLLLHKDAAERLRAEIIAIAAELDQEYLPPLRRDRLSRRLEAMRLRLRSAETGMAVGGASQSPPHYA